MTHDHSQAHGIYTCPMHPEVRQHGPGNCPICGMTLVPVEESAIKAVSVAPGGFDKVPEGWRGVVYTCPMHPEVRQTEPGSCPICGMGLERDATGAPDEGPNPELVDFTRRMWVGVSLTLPLLVLTMGPLVGLGWIREILGEKQSMDRTGTRHSGRPLVWLALPRAWLGFVPDLEAEHVQPDRYGGAGRLAVQCGGRVRTTYLPGRLPG